MPVNDQDGQSRLGFTDQSALGGQMNESSVELLPDNWSEMGLYIAVWS